MAVKIFNATETDYTGTVSADFIVGNNLGNVIDGSDGDDAIFGGGGNDILIGGVGNDAIFGGAGDDLIDVGGGNNVADGGAGFDNIYGGEDGDILSGGADDDVLYGGDGDDLLTGGSGFDYLQGDEASVGDETVDGNVYLMTSNDGALGGEDNDTFVIGSELDSTGIVIEAGSSDLDISGIEARYVDLEESSEDDEDAPLLAIDTAVSYTHLDVYKRQI